MVAYIPYMDPMGMFQVSCEILWSLQYPASWHIEKMGDLPKFWDGHGGFHYAIGIHRKRPVSKCPSRWRWFWLALTPWLVGGLVAIFCFPIYWESHHPNWLSYFSEGFKPPTRWCQPHHHINSIGSLFFWFTDSVTHRIIWFIAIKCFGATLIQWLADSLIHWFSSCAWSRSLVHVIPMAFQQQCVYSLMHLTTSTTSTSSLLLHLKNFSFCHEFPIFFLESFAVAQLGTICFTRYKGSHCGMDIKSHMGASKNGGYPQIIQFYRTFPEINHPANLGYPHDEQETSMYGVLTLAQIGKSAILYVNHWWFGGNYLIYFSGHFRNRLIGGYLPYIRPMFLASHLVDFSS